MIFSKNAKQQKEAQKDEQKNREDAIIDIQLGNDAKYSVGVTANGVLVLTANKDIKVKGLKLEVSGHEKTEVHSKNRIEVYSKNNKKENKSFRNQAGTAIETATGATTKVVYGENVTADQIMIYNDTFYHQDLSSFLTEGAAIEMRSGTTREFPFHFTIPNNALESYSGKKVWIEYKIKGVLDRSWKLDIRCEKPFTVYIPHRIIEDNASNPVVSNNASNTYGIFYQKSKDRVKEGGELEEDLQNASSNINEWLKETNEQSTHYNARLEIDGKDADYSAGDIIKGRLILEGKGGKDKNNIYREGITHEDIRNLEITFSAIERATARNYNEGTWKDGKVFAYRNDTIFEQIKHQIKLDSETKDIIPFEFTIPNDAKKSYRGKLSRYYWEVYAKLDLINRKDVELRSTINVV